MVVFEEVKANSMLLNTSVATLLWKTLKPTPIYKSDSNVGQRTIITVFKERSFLNTYSGEQQGRRM